MMTAGLAFGVDLSVRWGTVLAIDAVVWILFGWGLIILLALALAGDPAGGLAKRLNLALTPELRSRVNRFLRTRSVLRVMLLVLLSQLVLAATVNTSNARSSQATMMLLTPAGIWIASLVVSLWPRWKSQGPVHLAHLHRLRLKDAVTNVETSAIAGAYVLSAVSAGWALWNAGAPWRGWFWLPAALLAGQAAAAVAMCTHLMNAPASGRDPLELAWDDVLRLERTRSLLATSSFTTAFFILGNAADMAKVHASPILVGVVAALSVSGFLMFRDRSPGRNNWRRAWRTTDADGPPAPG